MLRSRRDHSSLLFLNLLLLIFTFPCLYCVALHAAGTEHAAYRDFRRRSSTSFDLVSLLTAKLLKYFIVADFSPKCANQRCL